MEAMVNSVYPQKIGNWMTAMAAISGIILIVTIIATITSSERDILFLHLVGWTVLPPTWFSLEYHCIYKKYGLPDSFEAFKHGQDVSAKVWLSAIAIVSAKLLALGHG
jgi:hypothetical protein